MARGVLNRLIHTLNNLSPLKTKAVKELCRDQSMHHPIGRQKLAVQPLLWVQKNVIIKVMV